METEQQNSSELLSLAPSLERGQETKAPTSTKRRASFNPRRLKRSLEIIQILNRYGVVSPHRLRQIMKPMPSLKQLQRSLETLAKHKLTSESYVMALDRQMPMFVHLSQNERARPKIAKALGIEEGDLPDRKHHYAHFVNEDLLAGLQLSIEEAYPNCITVRDWQWSYLLYSNPLLPCELTRFRSRPSLAVGIPLLKNTKTCADYCWIAIEMRSLGHKKWRRNHLFQHYANNSFWDGVLYICFDPQYDLSFEETIGDQESLLKLKNKSPDGNYSALLKQIESWQTKTYWVELPTLLPLQNWLDQRCEWAIQQQFIRLNECKQDMTEEGPL